MKTVLIIVLSLSATLSAACNVDIVSDEAAAGVGGNWTQVPLNDTTVNRLKQLAVGQVSGVVRAVAVVQAYRMQDSAANIVYYCIRFSASGLLIAPGYSASMECVAEGSKQSGYPLNVQAGTVACQNIIPSRCNMTAIRKLTEHPMPGGWSQISNLRSVDVRELVYSSTMIADLKRSASRATEAFSQVVNGLNFCVGFNSALKCNGSSCTRLSCVAGGYLSPLYNGFNYNEPIRNIGIRCMSRSVHTKDAATTGCSGAAVTGRCKKYSPRWFFNTTREQCESFVYGGCGGTANNYATQEDCIEACFTK